MSSFKEQLNDYNKLKKKVGIEEIPTIHDMIEKGQKEKLLKYSKSMKNKSLRDAVRRIAKYL